MQLLTGSSLVDFKIKLKTGITASNFDYEISLKNKTNSGELANASGSVTITKDTPATLATLSVNNLDTPLALTQTGTISDDFDVAIIANSYSGTEVLTSVKITS
ncbi:MAG: hypothetical protein LBD88_01320 [Candidatus Peribacteria bacterium]|nr:hypothetical protein [Candidatus Peribacteria bacterium]